MKRHCEKPQKCHKRLIQSVICSKIEYIGRIGFEEMDVTVADGSEDRIDSFAEAIENFSRGRSRMGHTRTGWSMRSRTVKAGKWYIRPVRGKGVKDRGNLPDGMLVLTEKKF